MEFFILFFFFMGFCSHFCGFYCVLWFSVLLVFWMVGCVVQAGGGGLNGVAVVETRMFLLQDASNQC